MVMAAAPLQLSNQPASRIQRRKVEVITLKTVELGWSTQNETVAGCGSTENHIRVYPSCIFVLNGLNFIELNVYFRQFRLLCSIADRKVRL